MLNLNQRQTGGWARLGQKRLLRVLVPFSRTLYYFDGPEQKGVACKALRWIPSLVKSKVRPKFVIIPTTRDRLLQRWPKAMATSRSDAFTVTDLITEDESLRADQSGDRW